MGLEQIRVKEVKKVIRYMPDSKRWTSKNRKDHIVGIMLSGKAHHAFDGHDFVLYGNCVYFFNQKEDYRVEVQETGESFSVHFTTFEEIEDESFCIPVHSGDEIKTILQRLEQGKGELFTLSLLYRLLDEIAKLRERKYFQTDKRVVEGAEYMSLHFKEKDCLLKAVAGSGLTARRFCDLFKSHFGVTPNRYIVMRRVECAKGMLQIQPLMVTSVAEACGFSDVYYFSRVFKREVGVSPKKYKESYIG